MIYILLDLFSRIRIHIEIQDDYERGLDQNLYKMLGINIL